MKEPSRSVELTSTKEQLEDIEKLISAANISIKKHNDIVTNYAKGKEQINQRDLEIYY